MPALPNVPGVLRLRLIGTINGSPWNAVQFARYVGTPPGDGSCQTIGTAVGQAWNNAIAQLSHTTVSLVGIEVTDLTDLDMGVGTASVNHPGTRVGLPLPNNAALVASYKIHVRYRGGHPRTYWPAGIQADIISGKNWDATFRTLAQGACTDYVGNINEIVHGSGPLEFCAVSYYKGKDPATGYPALRPVPVTYPITSVTVGTRVDTMRSRLGKESA